jgi:predicted Fe-S protein YdhL (DUF1289 family)
MNAKEKIIFCWSGGGMKTTSLQIESPCVKVCQMNEADGLCAGCCRTIGEIAAWSAMSDEQKARVVAELPRRKGGSTDKNRRNPLG